MVFSLLVKPNQTVSPWNERFTVVFFKIVWKLRHTPSSIPLRTSVIFITIAIFLIGKLYFSFSRIASAFDFEISFQVPLNASCGLYEISLEARLHLIQNSSSELSTIQTKIWVRRYLAVGRQSETFTLIHFLLDIVESVILNKLLRLHPIRMFYCLLWLTKIHLQPR